MYRGATSIFDGFFAFDNVFVPNTEFNCDHENVKTGKNIQLFCAQEGVRNLHRPNDFVGSIQHLLYKVKLQAKLKIVIFGKFLLTLHQAVFHGGLKSMWSSVMELPSGNNNDHHHQ